MKKKTRTCAVCRTQYKYCNQCEEDAKKPTWYFTFCSENCHDLYGILSAFEGGRVSEVDAKNKLSKLDLSNKENFGESYKETLKKIFVEKYTKKNKKKDEVYSDIDVNVNMNVSAATTGKSIIKESKEIVTLNVNCDLL